MPRLVIAKAEGRRLVIDTSRVRQFEAVPQGDLFGVCVEEEGGVTITVNAMSREQADGLVNALDRAIGDVVTVDFLKPDWVDGPPPKDGYWYVIKISDGDPIAVHWDALESQFCDGYGADFAEYQITSHYSVPVPTR